MRAASSLSPSIFAPMDKGLTPKQLAFVGNYVANGGQQAKAAIDAGYREGTAKSAASRLARNPLVQQAIMRQVLERIGLQAVPALHVIERLSETARSDYVRLEAARDLLDRAGFSPPQRMEHRLDHTLTVSLQLGMEGGSKTASLQNSDPTHTGKSFEKLLIGGEGAGEAEEQEGPALLKGGDVDFSTMQGSDDGDSGDLA